MVGHIIIFFMPTRWPKPLYMCEGSHTEISGPLHQEGCSSSIQEIVTDCLLVPGIDGLKEKTRCKHIRP